ncbi:MAG: metallophosphoesterase [Chloroflexi bacterium]|nr:MAG: metallophosphoesterase [Chloroflexota bacterium]
MKIAVISDIHGNYPALLRVLEDLEQWQPDHVIVAGDVVNRGPRSPECWQLIRQRQISAGWQVIRGNHEDYLLDCAQPDFPLSGPTYEIRQFAYWTYQQLNGATAEFATLPDRVSLYAPDQTELRVCHASMHHNRDGIYAESPDEVLMQQIAPPPAVFVTAHTHKPFVRQAGSSLVVNVGAVGAPFDQDPRASYGRFTWHPQTGWQAEIARVPYDRQQTEQDYVATGFLEEGGPLTQLMLIELRQARGLIFRWASQYEQAVLNEEITLAESVRRILMEEDVRPFLGPPGWVL